MEGRFEEDDKCESFGFRRGAVEVSVAGTWCGVTGCSAPDATRQRSHISFMIATPLYTYNHKSKASMYRQGQALRVPGGWDPRLPDIRYMKVVSLSALRTGRLHPQEITLVLISIGAWGSVVVKALRCKSVSPGIDSKRWRLKFILWQLTFPCALKMSTRIFLGVKTAGA